MLSRPTSPLWSFLPAPGRVLAALAALGAAAGCAGSGGGGAATQGPTGQRVIITTMVEWPSAAEVASRVADLAGVPVRDAMEDAPRRYRMTLQCGADEAACDAAIRKVSAARTLVHTVERDPRQRIPGKPDRESSR